MGPARQDGLDKSSSARETQGEASFNSLTFIEYSILKVVFINLDIFYLNPNDTLNGLLTQYDSYTGLTLEGYFSCFLVLLSVQFFSVLIIKLLMVKRMRTEGSKLDILRHCFENMNIPVPWEDFDVQRGKIEDYKKRRVSVHKEMFLLMVVNLMFHLLMLVPLIYTGASFQENCLLSFLQAPTSSGDTIC